MSVLGAGTIIRRGGEVVEGLTTAAALLLAAAVGVFVAAHQVVLAVGVTILVLVILRVLMWVEQRVVSSDG